MLGRVQRIGLLVLSIVAATVLSFTGVLLRTEPGREVFTRTAVSMLSGVLNGTAAVDSIGGSLTGGLTIHHLTVHDRQGDLFVRIPQLRVRYRLTDLLSRRVVLGQVILDDPFVNVLRSPDGHMNFEEVLGLAHGGDGGGFKPLVAFRDVEVNRANVLIRTPTDAGWGHGEGYEVEPVDGKPGHHFRVRRVEDLNASLSYVRLVSPFPDENGLQFDVESLTVRLTDPALDIRRLRGQLVLDGSTLRVEADELVLPGTETTLSGTIRWPDGDLMLALDLDARRASVDDVKGLVPVLPWGMAGLMRGTIRSIRPDSMVVDFPELRLSGVRGGGSLAGSFGAVIDDTGLAAFQRTELAFDTLAIDLLRPLLDTIPFAGRISGRLSADGRLDSLQLGVGWLFYDSLVAEPGVRGVRSWPRNALYGRGRTQLGGPASFVFRDFAVDSVDLDLRTVRRLVPAIELQGRLGITGTISGPWEAPELSGRLTHGDDSLPPSSLFGLMRWDSRRDTLGVWADVTLDSLDFRGVQPSYPQLPRQGVWAGRVHLAGYLHDLDAEADLSGPGGEMHAFGRIVALPDTLGFRSIDAEFAALNVGHFVDGAVTTELFGSLSGAVWSDSLGLATGRFAVALDSSYLVDSPIDSLRGSFSLADGVLRADSMDTWAPGVVASAEGSLGLQAERQGRLRVGLRIDSLATMESLVRGLAGTADRGELLANLDGTTLADLILTGSTDAYTARLGVAVPELASEELFLEGLALEAEWESRDSGRVELTASLDSLNWSGRFYTDAELRTTGRKTENRWFGRARIGMDASLIGWGTAFNARQVLVVPIDSVRILAPNEVWRLDPGALVSISDSGVVFRNFRLETASGGSRFVIDGLLPQRGSGTLQGSIDFLPFTSVAAMLQLDPGDFSGTVSGTYLLRGTGADPRIEASLSLNEGRFGNVRLPLLRGTVRYTDQRLVADYRLRRSGDTIMTFAADLPLDLALTPVPERRLPGPITIRALAQGVDLDFVELATRNIRETTGRLTADVGIAGSWEAPELTGFVEIAGGGGRVPNLGVRYRNLEGRFRFTGDTIAIERLQGATGRGTASLDGFVRLEGLRQPRMNLGMTLNRFELIDVPGFLEATASGNVRLTGPVFGATLTGGGTVTDGVLYFADLVEKDIVNLEDSLYASLLGDTTLIRRQGLRSNFESRFLDSLTITDLQLTMGSAAWLRSNEANIQLAGQLQVGKIRDQYRFDGTLQTPRGTYRLPFVNKDFAVTGGQVQYFGTPDLNAAVDIDAQRTVRTIRDDILTVFVNVGGTLYEPELRLTSDHEPPLPESELISYLLFNAPSVQADYSFDQRVTIGTVAAQIGFGVASAELERALIADLGVPVDYLQIRPTSDFSGTQVAIGKQLGERWFVTFSPRVCAEEFESFDPVTAFYPSVEYRVSRNWRFAFSADPASPCQSVPGNVGNFRTQFGLDFLWDKRY